MNEYPDNELVNLVCENSEEANDILYDKYNYIIDIIVKKYKRGAYALSVDINELTQEARYGFSDALVSFNQDRDTSLPTFITLCVERRVRNYLRHADTEKYKLLRTAYSLEDDLFGTDSPLENKIGSRTYDPEVRMQDAEDVKNLKEKIDNLLSPAEKEIYKLLINDFSYEDIASILNKDIKSVYNAISRIRVKIKKIL
jgi:RNA polymerase sporulation-specific sigma factor